MALADSALLSPFMNLSKGTFRETRVFSKSRIELRIFPKDGSEFQAFLNILTYSGICLIR